MPADMTLGDAISSGVPEDVVKVLGRMTDEETARELTAVEGVKHHAATPILRSARSGNVALFKAVHQSMKTKLNDAQVRWPWTFRQSSQCVAGVFLL